MEIENHPSSLLTHHSSARLTVKQRLFIDYYLSSLNATESAIKAGYKGAYVNRIGSSLLRTPKIKEVIDDRLSTVIAKNNGDITPDWIRQRIKETVSECKNPKDKFIGLELLAKATPGTFERDNAQPSTINFVNILKGIASDGINKGKDGEVSSIDSDAGNGRALNLSNPKDEATVGPINSTTVDNSVNAMATVEGMQAEPIVDEEIKNIGGALDAYTPPPTDGYNNKVVHKIA